MFSIFKKEEVVITLKDRLEHAFSKLSAELMQKDAMVYYISESSVSLSQTNRKEYTIKSNIVARSYDLYSRTIPLNAELTYPVIESMLKTLVADLRDFSFQHNYLASCIVEWKLNKDNSLTLRARLYNKEYYDRHN